MALCSVFALNAETLDFARSTLKKGKNDYGIYQEGRFKGTISCENRQYAGKLNAEIKDGFLRVDASAIPINGKQNKVVLRFFVIGKDELVRCEEGKNASEKINRIEIFGKSIPGGLDASLFFEGNDGGHFWRSTKAMFRDSDTALSYEQYLPHNLKDCHIRLDLHKPGVYLLKSVSFAAREPEKSAIDPKKNNILNGGAESGMAYTHQEAPIRDLRNAETGKFTDWRRVEMTGSVKVGIDSENAYEGKYCFRLDAPNVKNYWGALAMNPVPCIPGHPFTISFYAKSSKPQNLSLSLFLASGIATGSSVPVGTEWKRYEIVIPEWGGKYPFLHNIGDIVSGNAKPTGVVVPIFRPSVPGTTVWLDNIACTLGTEAEFKDSATIHLNTRLDKANACYFTGEPLKAAVTVESLAPTAVSGFLAWEIRDVFGGKLAEGVAAKAVSVPAKGKAVCDAMVVPPSGLRGPFNLIFRWSDHAGNKAEMVSYAGILERNAKLSKRIGVEVSAGQNVENVIPYLKLGRIGTVRIGGASGRQDLAAANAPFFDKAGIEVLMNFSPVHKAAVDAQLWEKERRRIEDLIARYGRHIYIFEVKNEPNISPGWTVDLNLKAIREMSEMLKKYNCRHFIAGPTPCGTDFTWISSVLSAKGKGAELLSAVTEHPYRQLPELPDYAQDAASVKKIIETYRPGLPYYATESGRTYPNVLPAAMIDDYNRTAAARDVRNMIQGFSGGLDRYYHFCFLLGPKGTGWNLLFAGNADNDFVSTPNIAFYAIRALIDRLEDAKCVGRVPLGLDFRCAIFDHGQKRTAVLWKWNGKPGMLVPRADAGTLTAYDFVGNRIPAEKLVLNEYPVYLDTTRSAKELEQMIRRGELIAEGSDSVSLAALVHSADSFTVEVKNKTARVLKNVLCKVETPDIVSGESAKTIAEIAPESSANAVFKLKRNISTADRMIRLSAFIPANKETVRLDANLRGLLVYKTGKPFVIDGDLSDWDSRFPVITLDRNNVDPACKSPSWGAKEDRIKAELRYAWDDNFLYTAVTVYKPELNQLRDEKNYMQSWKYDGVQICYDTLRNAVPSITSLQDDDFEYGLQMLNDKPVVTRRNASSAVYDSLGKNSGIVDPLEVPFAVKKYDDRVVYEAAFSRRAVSPFKLRPYSAMRASLIVNVNNGKERVGFFELTPGIGQQPKRPDQWMDLVLLP